MILTEGARLSDTHQFQLLSGWWRRTEGPSRFTELQLRGPQTEGLKDKDTERERDRQKEGERERQTDRQADLG